MQDSILMIYGLPTDFLIIEDKNIYASNRKIKKKIY